MAMTLLSTPFYRGVNHSFEIAINPYKKSEIPVKDEKSRTLNVKVIYLSPFIIKFVIFSDLFFAPGLITSSDVVPKSGFPRGFQRFSGVSQGRVISSLHTLSVKKKSASD